MYHWFHWYLCIIFFLKRRISNTKLSILKTKLRKPIHPSWNKNMLTALSMSKTSNKSDIYFKLMIHCHNIRYKNIVDRTTYYTVHVHSRLVRTGSNFGLGLILVTLRLDRSNPSLYKSDRTLLRYYYEIIQYGLYQHSTDQTGLCCY